jgi:hypothetical protein
MSAIVGQSERNRASARDCPKSSAAATSTVSVQVLALTQKQHSGQAQAGKLIVVL